MKKSFLVVSCLILLLTITGCSKKKQIVCSKTSTQKEKTVIQEGIFKLDDDGKVIDAIGSYTFSDKETAQSYCELFKKTYDTQYPDSISCTDTKVAVKDLDKAAGNDSNSQKLVGMTKSELVKLEESLGYRCQ